MRAAINPGAVLTWAEYVAWCAGTTEPVQCAPPRIARDHAETVKPRKR